MFKSHFARPPAKCVTAFHEVRPCTPCETNLARQGKRGWAVRFYSLLHPTQALEHTHRAVRPALQVPSCQESLHVPGFKVRADCSYLPTPCARHNTGCGVACSMPPRIRTGVPELNGVAFATTGAVWHMTQSPFGRVRCDMCIYAGVSKSAGNGVKTGNFVGGKARSEEGSFCTRAKSGLHVNPFQSVSSVPTVSLAFLWQQVWHQHSPTPGETVCDFSFGISFRYSSSPSLSSQSSVEGLRDALPQAPSSGTSETG